MSRIRTAPLCLALLCLLTPLTLGAGREDGGNAPPPAEPGRRDLQRENTRLRAEVESLKSRVSVLESRVKELEVGKPPAPRPAPRVVPPQVVPKPRFAPRQSDPLNAPRPLPEGWQERKFNGMTYYIVPLRPGDAKAATTRPAAVEPAAPR